MTEQKKILIGWREWCALPDLGVQYIKAKVDTGAKTSAIHAFNIKEYSKNEIKHVEFDIHPLQNNDEIVISNHAVVHDERYIMSSNGHKEKRYVILTMLQIGELCYEIEITLSRRDPLKFRMLLGRDALKNHCIIDPSQSKCLGKKSTKTIEKYYRKIL